METVTLLIALVALLVALLAFRRTGGLSDTRRQLGALSSKTDAIREKTADVLERLEELVRGKEKERTARTDGERSVEPGDSK